MTAPATLDPRLEDTAPPGLPARREWRPPHVVSHAAVALTAAKLVVTPVGGAEPEYALAAVRRAGLSLAADAVAVDLDGRPAAPVVRFADAATADDFFARLVRRAGADYTLATDRPTRLELARGPLGVMAGVLLATATLAVTVAGVPDVAANWPAAPGPVAALARLDWRAVTGGGGVALAVAQVWLARRLARPPGRLVLTRN